MNSGLHLPRSVRVASTVLLTAYALYSVLPLLWMLNLSLRSPQRAFELSLSISDWTISNYVAAVVKFGQAFGNSLIVAVGSTGVSLLLGVLGAYGLSRYRFRGRELAGLVLVSGRLLPPVLMVMGLFVVFQKVRLYDSLTAVLIANSLYTLPFAVWMLRSYFDAIPVSLDEAARVDGARVGTIIMRVILPLARPGLVTTTVYCFLLAWNDLLYGLTFILSPEKKVVTVLIAEQSGEWWTNYPEMMAMATLFTLPMLLAFALIQRNLIAGLGAGAVKS